MVFLFEIIAKGRLNRVFPKEDDSGKFGNTDNVFAKWAKWGRYVIVTQNVPQEKS